MGYIARMQKVSLKKLVQIKNQLYANNKFNKTIPLWYSKGIIFLVRTLPLVNSKGDYYILNKNISLQTLQSNLHQEIYFTNLKTYKKIIFNCQVLDVSKDENWRVISDVIKKHINEYCKRCGIYNKIHSVCLPNSIDNVWVMNATG